MKTESPLTLRARELRAAKAAGTLPPVMPCTTLKRGSAKRRVRTLTVEVEKKPLMLKICDLAFHPHLKRVGLLPALIEREEQLGLKSGKSRDDHKGHAEELTQEFEALKLSILDHGLRDPIKVVKDAKGNWQVVDGRHRFQAVQHIIAANSLLNPNHTHNSAWLANADKLEKEGIPCIEIQPHEVNAVIMDAVKRRHFSKGALAYLAVLMQPAIATEGKRGGDQKSNRRNCGLIEDATTGARIAALAAKTGVSERMMEYAIRLYKTFSERDDARVIFEPSIWVGASLDRLIGGVEHFVKYGVDENETPETEEQKAAGRRQAAFLSFACHLADVGKCWSKWDDLGPVLQETMVKHNIREAFAGAPPAMRSAAIAALSEEAES